MTGFWGYFAYCKNPCKTSRCIMHAEKRTCMQKNTQTGVRLRTWKADSCKLLNSSSGRKTQKTWKPDLVFLLCGIQMSCPEAKKPSFDLFLSLDLTHRNFIPLQRVWAQKVKCRSYINITTLWLLLQCGNLMRLRPQWCIKCFTAGLSLWCCSSFHVPFHCCNTEA